MRTLAATFETREEAESACRRLEAIGVSRDRIVLKDLAGTAEGSAGAPGGVFVSLKVTNEQVEPVNDILKRQPKPAEASPPSAQPPQSTAAPHRAPEPELPPRPLSSVASEPGFGAPAAGHPRSQPQPRSGKLTPQDRARLGRNVILFCLVLVVAFMVGAWLGMLS